MDIDLKQLEDLTKIRVPQEGRAPFLQSMNDILGYVSQLQQVQTNDTDMLEHITPNVNTFRADVVITDQKEREASVAAFPKKVAGLLDVPAVFE